MEQGRGNQTFRAYGQPPTSAPATSNFLFRNLMKSQLGGVIFGCKHSTMKECLSKQLFGLPHHHFAYVKNIGIGLPLFLFNYSDRKLHGIFEAAGSGQLNIDPYGWTSGGSERSPYPAQVQIRVRLHCLPLTEDKFKPAIADNYYNPHHFWFELDHFQTNKLICLLASFAVAPGPPVPAHPRNSRPVSWVTSSTERKGNNHEVKLPALGVEAPTHNEKSSDEAKGSLEDLLDRRRKSDSSDFVSLPDSDDLLLENYSDARVAEEKDKGLVLVQSKDLTLRQEHQDVSPVKTIEHVDPLISKNLEDKDKDALEEQTCSEGKSEDNFFVSSDCQSIMSQMMDELKKLRALGMENSKKIHYLEHKLVEANTEIRRLKEHCMMFESMSDSLNAHTDDSVMDSLDDLPLDLSESMLLMGGYDGESFLSSVHSYFPAGDVVKAHSPMSSVRAYAAVTRLDGEIYVFGGGDGHEWYDTAESYNLSNDKWRTCPSLNVKKGSLGGATLNDKIFAIGGGNGLASFSDVEMLDLDVGRWIRTRSMLQKRFAVATVEHNGAIYAVGGYDGNEYLNTAERFDPREHSWTRVANMKLRRGCHSLVVLNDKLYAIGGFNGETMVSSVEMYDPRLELWMSGEPLNDMRGYSAAAVVKDSIYVIGGLKNEEEGILNSVEYFKEGQGWKNITQTTIGRRCFLAAIAP